MFGLARIAPLALTLTLICTAPALAAQNVFYVQGTSDPAIAGCQPYEGIPGFFRCDSVRAAVDAANANVNATEETDVVYLQAGGVYTVARELTLSDRVTIVGRGPRTTTISGGNTTRVFNVAAGVPVNLYRFGIANGAVPGDGGNILNRGDLFLLNTHVTGGTAGRGGGIANVGTGSLLIANSLIDENNAISLGFGGGIYNEAIPPGDVLINNSTIAYNTAAGEFATGGGLATTNGASLFGVTLARNTAGVAAGIYSGSSADGVNMYGSIIAANTIGSGGLANCGGPGTTTDDGATNVEDGVSSCEIASTGNPGLSPDLVNAGGDTDVFTIPSTGVAKDRMNPCFTGTDQRDAQRATGAACDAGAFEEGAVAPAIDSNPFPDPIPPTATATPTPTPTPIALPAQTPTPTASPQPTPVANQTVVAKEVKGTVKVRLRGTNRFVDLGAAQGIPVGSTFDTKRGTVELTSIPAAGKPPEKAEFHDGIFLLTQSRGITDLKLTEPLSCPKRAGAAQKKPKSRKLWGKGSGKFRTTGNYSAATIRGTEWLVQDTCKGTLTKVKQGVVSVRDKVKKRTLLLRAPRSYTARPRR